MRIVGGRWRNTKLAVPDLPGLRPTGERVRETVFNWLMPKIAGARVLDLFAGSGALGLEAVSRGAASAVLVERDPGLAARLREQVARLGAGDQVEVVQDDALRWLQRQPRQAFDIAFVDPPFADSLWSAALAALPPQLAADAWLYVEAGQGADLAVSAPWLLHRDGATREVRYALYRRAATLAGDLNPTTDA